MKRCGLPADNAASLLLEGGTMGKRIPVAPPGEKHAGLCALQYAEGRIEVCPGPGCPFWEEGGAVVPGRCLIERLGLDLEGRPELAHGLLQIRRKLDQAGTEEDENEARSLFYRLVPAARSEDLLDE
jgi:hypothetical protein